VCVCAGKGSFIVNKSDNGGSCVVEES